MIVSAWYGGTYGIRVGKRNAQEYFSKEWSEISVEIDGEVYSFKLSSTFWTTCPEFRGKPITNWFKKLNATKWPKGNPPRFELTHIVDNRFKLSFINNDIKTITPFVQQNF